MPPDYQGRRLARNFAACVLLVVLMAPLMDVSVLISLMILVGLVFLYRTLRILADSRDQHSPPPGDPAGDRSPIRP